jgi:hypothetical protein
VRTSKEKCLCKWITHYETMTPSTEYGFDDHMKVRWKIGIKGTFQSKIFVLSWIGKHVFLVLFFITLFTDFKFSLLNNLGIFIDFCFVKLCLRDHVSYFREDKRYFLQMVISFQGWLLLAMVRSNK